ncbi:luc7-like protein 3 [Odontomachus brunneus]|uniref:luc7-like protein 3 n=1 Tax=Odontomachus brunneus TaxID=486640 RepID=UPI0013F1AFB5|nr:luc7-like protein 3 [Odontomachus brunneus]
MARYSSESDSDYSSRYRRRRNRRSRSSGSNSSDSSPHRRRLSKHSKTKRRHRSNSRSRGRDRNSKNYRGSGSSHSRDRDKRHYRSSTGRSHSSDRSKRKARSTSREKSQSPSSSSQSNQAKINIEKSQVIVGKDDFSIEPRFKESILDEINAEGFTPKQFTSSTKESKFKNIVIDISTDTIQIPPAPSVSSGSESIFHTSIMIDQEARFEKWVKKLYTLRQKAIADLVHTNVI